MNIILLSIDFKLTPIPIRENFSFRESEIPSALNSLLSECKISESVIVSTCNRTEIYAISNELNITENILVWWQKYKLISQIDLKKYVNLFYDTDAVTHLMRTSCGLESMVIGEPQILGQLKKAYSIARSTNSLGPHLSHAFESAFSLAKKVRASTKIGSCPVSVAFSAVSLAKANFENLSNKKVLIIGAGNTARLVSQHLNSCQPKSIIIANRTLSNASSIAKNVNGKAIYLSEIHQYYDEVDIIVCAVSNLKEYIIKSATLHRLENKLIVDLSMPRVIEPTEQMKSSVNLYSIDDIRKMLKDNESTRNHAAQIAEKIIKRKVNEYIANKKVRKASNTIVAFRRHTEDIVKVEVEKSLKKLKNGADPEEILTRFAHTLQNKILHKPTISLRKASVDGKNELLGMAQQLFSNKQ